METDLLPLACSQVAPLASTRGRVTESTTQYLNWAGVRGEVLKQVTHPDS